MGPGHELWAFICLKGLHQGPRQVARFSHSGRVEQASMAHGLRPKAALAAFILLPIQ